MSTYYEYKDVKVMIAHKLMNMEGWKVYGYHEDQSDSMTDYYCPAYWDGVAEKNGYVLCVGVYGASIGEEIRKYNHSAFTYDSNITDKIQKLKAMTVERGASEQEEQSAKNMIERLQKKAEETQENNNKYIVTGFRPAHMAHPPKCNWHIEKDGIIIAKGNGILKYASIDSYYNYDREMEQYKEFIKLGAEEWEKKQAKTLLCKSHYYDNEEDAKKGAKYQREKIEKDSKLIESFESFITKLDTTCGCLVGEGELETYETIKITEYKKENKVVEYNGEIKEGQCFILKSSFNYGRRKGFVYRIHESEYNGKKQYHAYKLNGKLTKECTGRADQSNHWGHVGSENFMKWIEKGSISFCNIEEVSTPYEVKKVVKKTVKSDRQPKGQEVSNDNTKPNLTYEVIEDTDTRDNSKIFVVKVKEKLSREDYIILNNYMKSIGGYYSKFKHGFIFKENPTEFLNGNIDNYTQTNEQKVHENKQQKQQEQKQSKKQQLTDKINKQIEGVQKKIDGLSGNYKTNTWKRMNEQASRDLKIEAYQKYINLLQYLIDTLDNRELTPLEENLIISSFSDEIQSFYSRNEAYNSKDRGTALKPIEFPRINYNSPLDGWYNVEVPKRQKRLQKAGINNTIELLKAVEEYKVIYTIINKPINHTEKKIKQLEREYKMKQKGDINFTPSEVAKQLVEYSGIDENSRVLEPSAGIGKIADEIKQYTNNIDVCEQMYHFNELLKLKGYNVVGNDFLQYKTDNKYDAIIMNPPFSDEQNHIKHAYELLKDSGILVSITSPHWTFANDKKSVEFRQWLENETYYTKDLPNGTFEMTGVATKILVIEKHKQTESKTA